MTERSPEDLLRKAENGASLVATRRAALQDALVPLGVRSDEVEADLYEYVMSLQRSGVPPEGMLIAVKGLLAERSVPLGVAAQVAFEHAQHNHLLAETIVALAIGFYFGATPLGS